MFSFSSYFNRQSLTLIGLIVILISIPLTAMLAQKAQELRGRAAPSGEVTFTDANGNPLGQTTTSQDVYLKINLPDGWTLAQRPPQNPLAKDLDPIKKVYAQSACSSITNCADCTSSTAGCGWADGSRCIPGYASCPADASSWAYTTSQCTFPIACPGGGGGNTPTPTPPQAQPTPTSTPPPQPTATPPPTVTPAPAASSCTPNDQIDTIRHCRLGTTTMCTYNVWRGSDCSTGEGDPYNCQDSSECGYQPPSGPTVLRQIYIQNKDGGSGGHTPARITDTGDELSRYKRGNYLLVPWKLTDGVGQKTVQVDFYEQPNNDSAGRRTTTTSITLTAPEAGAPAAGKDVGDCKEIKIDGVPIESVNHPAIVVGKSSKITMTMRNTPPGGQTGKAAPVPTTVQTTVWGSNYSLRFIGTSGNEYDLGITKTKIDTNQSVGPGNEVSFDVFINPRSLPTGETTKEFTEFKWRMHDDKGTPFGGECSPGITVYATAPGASPGPTAEPGTCLAQPVSPPAQFSCVFSPTDLSSCLGWQERTGMGWASKPEFSCPTGKSCYYCSNISVPTPTPPTPTPTPETLACAGTNVFCDSDVGVPRDPSQFNCQSLGRRACQPGTTCWRCSPITVTPTPTTPPAGTPTPTPTGPPSPIPACTPLNGPYPNPLLLGDANCDGRVDEEDFSIWKNEFTGISSGQRSDFNRDTIIDGVDFNLWRRAFLAL